MSAHTAHTLRPPFAKVMDEAPKSSRLPGHRLWRTRASHSVSGRALMGAHGFSQVEIQASGQHSRALQASK